MNINFDLDGTIVDLYGVPNWLDDLIAHNPRPYTAAAPLVNLSWLARTIHELQQQGHNINIISWLSKNSNDEYDEAVTNAKLEWLEKHLPSVHFDNIIIVKYGTCKADCGTGILFDDEEKNRNEWNGIAFDEANLIKTLRCLL